MAIKMPIFPGRKGRKNVKAKYANRKSPSICKRLLD